MADRIQLLCELLLDKQEEGGARDDAALLLQDYAAEEGVYDERALQALLTVGSDMDKNEAWIHDVVGEAIGHYLAGMERYDVQYLQGLSLDARGNALDIMEFYDFNRTEALRKQLKAKGL